MRLAVWMSVIAGLGAVLLAGRIGDTWIVTGVVLVASALAWRQDEAPRVVPTLPLSTRRR